MSNVPLSLLDPTGASAGFVPTWDGTKVSWKAQAPSGYVTNTALNAALQSYAPINNPTFTGQLVAPTISTPQLAGVTNAPTIAPTYVGEVLQANQTVASIVTTTNTNIASLALTPGFWLIYGSVSYQNGSVPVTSAAGGFSTTSATPGALPSSVNIGANLTSNTFSSPVPLAILNISAAQTIYLVGSCAFASGTTVAKGQIVAVRIR